MKLISEDDIFKYRQQLISGKDRLKTWTDGKGPNASKFRLLALFPREERIVSNLMANSMTQPADRYTIEALRIMERAAMIQAAVWEGPDWWPDNDDCPDEDLAERLWIVIDKWKKEVQESLKKNRPVARSPEPEPTP